MSIILVSGAAITNSPMNTSLSKQQYSFSKAERFKSTRSVLNQKVSYDLPSLFSKRATSIGYGRRTVVQKDNGMPGPGSVEMRGAFDKGSPRVRAFSFGLSREHFKRVFLKENLQTDPCVPGPGQYRIPSVIGREGQPVSIKGRNLKEKTDRTGWIPGPGAYQPKLEFDSQGRYFVSRLKSVQGTIFGGPAARSPRFERDRANVTPGPGTYPLRLGVGDRSEFNLSTLRTPAVRTFYHSDRKIFQISKDAARIPGPGLYQAPSEFGIYESKFKHSFSGDPNQSVRSGASPPKTAGGV